MSNEIKIKIESTTPVADPVHLKTVKYDNLTSKPKINGVELVGDKSTKDLGIEVDTSEFPTREEFEQRMGEIQSVIPPTANYDNQLADQGFVNSSIQTSTAHFRGNWDTWADVPSDAELYPADAHSNHEPTPNDYLVVVDDEQGGTWRYKYTGVWAEQGKDGWQAEYQVNETPLTAAQLAALNSGVTAQKVADITTNKNAIAGLQVSKQDKLTAGTGITIDGNTISSTGGGASLPDQVGNAGKFLTTDGVTASWSLGVIKYKTGNDYDPTSLFISDSSNSGSSIANIKGSLRIGGNYFAQAGNVHYNTIIGIKAYARDNAIAIGYNAGANGNYSIQLGTGTNADANTFKVANANGNFEMMDANGNVPLGRLTYVTNQIGDISTALTAILGE